MRKMNPEWLFEEREGKFKFKPFAHFVVGSIVSTAIILLLHALTGFPK